MALFLSFELKIKLRYRRSMRKVAIMAAILILSACGPASNDPGPGGVTVGEAKALDEAAEMLDERNAPPEPVEQSGASPEMAEEQAQ